MREVSVRVPRYHRIAEALRERIRDGELTAGERLPNQRQLAHQFGVTLMTLRQALEVLEREKLIDRRHGLGTFVAAPSIDYDILALRRFAGDLTALGEQVTTRVLGNLFGVADRRGGGGPRPRSRARILARGGPSPGRGPPLSPPAPVLAPRRGRGGLSDDPTATPLPPQLR